MIITRECPYCDTECEVRSNDTFYCAECQATFKIEYDYDLVGDPPRYVDCSTIKDITDQQARVYDSP